MRDNLGLIKEAREIGELAAKVNSSGERRLLLSLYTGLTKEM